MAKNEDLFCRFDAIRRRRGSHGLERALNRAHSSEPYRGGDHCSSLGSRQQTSFALTESCRKSESTSDGCGGSTQCVESGMTSSNVDGFSGASCTSVAEWEAKWRELRSEESALNADLEEHTARRNTLESEELKQLQPAGEGTASGKPISEELLWDGIRRLRRHVGALRRLGQDDQRDDGDGTTEHWQLPEEEAKKMLASVREEHQQDSNVITVSVLELEQSLVADLRDFDSSLIRHLAVPPGRPSWKVDERRSNPNIPSDSTCGRVSQSIPVESGCASPSIPRASGRAGRREFGGVPAPGLVAWSHDSGRSPAPTHVPKADADPEIKDIRAAAEAIEHELRQSVESNCGWPKVNHEIFMQVFRRCQKQVTPEFYSRLEERMRDVPFSELVAHTEIVLMKEDRELAQRQLLVRWRERLQELAVEAAEADEVVVEKRKCKLANQRQRRRLEQRRLLSDWRSARYEAEERAAIEQSKAAEDHARVEEERQVREQRDRAAKKRALQAMWCERDRARQDAEAQAEQLRSEKRRIASKERRLSIQRRNADMSRRKSDAQLSTQPVARHTEAIARSRAFLHVESRLYENTQSFSQKVSTKWGCEPLAEPEPVMTRTSSASAVLERPRASTSPSISRLRQSVVSSGATTVLIARDDCERRGARWDDDRCGTHSDGPLSAVARERIAASETHGGVPNAALKASPLIHTPSSVQSLAPSPAAAAVLEGKRAPACGVPSCVPPELIPSSPSSLRRNGGATPAGP
eukprot:TRINITY_DN73788_c0_g1_i1.p1 TRINITY_DN73788_c0_g1~~TRINITY_DN73788_c0_g1_i1.p1  ORF type:complete len:754 (-),score=132.08 TRINITY_DN73788_c0_g1_i1:206-2467(-)